MSGVPVVMFLDQVESWMGVIPGWVRALMLVAAVVIGAMVLVRVLAAAYVKGRDTANALDQADRRASGDRNSGGGL